MSENTPDVVERLRADRPVSQFDSAGRHIRFDATPTPLELEAADEIASLRSDLSRMREASADKIAMVLSEALRIEDGRIAGIAFAAVQIAEKFERGELRKDE